MSKQATAILGHLERRKADFGEAAGARKLDLLRQAARARFARASEVLRLHEVLCFLRAYPDDAEVLAQVERMLGDFHRRSDLRRWRKDLANSGVAGTETRFPFFPAMASWLACRWGSQLSIDWDEFEGVDKLEPLLAHLALYSESPGLDEFAFTAREWIERFKHPRETDAAFMVRRWDQLSVDPFLRETLLEDLDIPFLLAPGDDTPARTREKWSGTAIAFQTKPLQRSRPSIRREIHEPPRSETLLSPRDGRRLIDLARGAMAVRSRDLDAFAYGDERDVRLLDCGEGLQFVYIGVRPERRFLLETLYGFLVLKNGIVVGYGTHTGLFGSSEVAFTIFDTFRSSEAAVMYGHALSTARYLFGFDAFMVSPYQLGDDNEDAIRSGAWWFYRKLGFEPRDLGLRRIVRREEGRMKAKPTHRSSAATLRKLATGNVYLDIGARRDDVMGVLPLANVGLRITRYLAQRFGHDRREAARTCSRDAAQLLGVRSMRSFAPDERAAWVRWSPLIMTLPGVRGWSREHKRALVAVVRAKGGRHEIDYLRQFDRHRLLRRAIRRLAQSE